MSKRVLVFAVLIMSQCFDLVNAEPSSTAAPNLNAPQKTLQTQSIDSSQMSIIDSLHAEYNKYVNMENDGKS